MGELNSQSGQHSLNAASPAFQWEEHASSHLGCQAVCFSQLSHDSFHMLLRTVHNIHTFLLSLFHRLSQIFEDTKSLCIFPSSACIQYPWMMQYVFPAICLASLLASHTKKRIFLPKILPFIHTHSHFCFQQLIETSGNSKFSCFIGYHTFSPKSANIHLPFPPLSSTLHNLWPNCLFNPFLHLQSLLLLPLKKKSTSSLYMPYISLGLYWVLHLVAPRENNDCFNQCLVNELIN